MLSLAIERAAAWVCVLYKIRASQKMFTRGLLVSTKPNALLHHVRGFDIFNNLNRMPTHIISPSKAVASILRCRRNIQVHRQYATAAAAITSTTSHQQLSHSLPPSPRYPSTQPPSYKPPEVRKSQLLRQYASLLRSTPLMLIFQHNNMKSSEWVGLRRELTLALRKADEARVAAGQPSTPLADVIKMQTIQTGIFAAALKIVEFYKPEVSNSIPNPMGSGAFPRSLTHTLSKAAHEAVAEANRKHALSPLLSGPLMVLTFPNVSPQHLKAALSILSPSAPQFPAPTRRANPGWHDAGVQAGLQKLLLLGARVEGKVFDVEKTKWVGGIDGGIDGLRAQLVAMLQSSGAGVTSTLESASRSIYFTIEGRRSMLEEDANPARGELPEKLV